MAMNDTKCSTPVFSGDYSREQLEECQRQAIDARNDDIELTVRALHACGYRTHIKERNGTRWVTALKGLDVRYEHWHPLTNINQAMQLLLDAPEALRLTLMSDGAYCNPWGATAASPPVEADSCPQALIAAQCRAIVTACASLEVVR